VKRNFVFTSESVTEGHPDKLCDHISDALVGRYLRRDRLSRVAAECAVSTGILFVAVKATTTATVDIPSTARAILDEIGYGKEGFSSKESTVMTSISEVDPSDTPRMDEEALADNEFDNVPARDQVTLFGFACNQTPALLPMPIWLAHQLARQLDRARHDGVLPYLLPDGKTQVGIEYRNRRPYRVHGLTVLTATRKPDDRAMKAFDHEMWEAVVEPVFATVELKPDADTRVDFNPEGALVGGPALHSGLTGRKTAVDTYGEYARHSGAALSGKDPSRVDRVAAYAARHAAKNVVAAGLSSECEIQLTYAIGQAQPVSVHVQTFGTGVMDDEKIEARVLRAFDFRPAAIVKAFTLRRLPSQHHDGFYAQLATYGHVGRMDLDLPWERTDVVEKLTH
jgi:S-adenosylmethionine synthetase